MFKPIAYLTTDEFGTELNNYYQLAEGATMSADIISALEADDACAFCANVYVFDADMKHAYVAHTAEDDHGWYYLTGEWSEIFPTVPYYEPCDVWPRYFNSVRLALYAVYGLPIEVADEMAENAFIDVDVNALLKAYYEGAVKYCNSPDYIEQCEADGLDVWPCGDGALVWY